MAEWKERDRARAVWVRARRRESKFTTDAPRTPSETQVAIRFWGPGGSRSPVRTLARSRRRGEGRILAGDQKLSLLVVGIRFHIREWIPTTSSSGETLRGRSQRPRARCFKEPRTPSKRCLSPFVRRPRSGTGLERDASIARTPSPPAPLPQGAREKSGTGLVVSPRKPRRNSPSPRPSPGGPGEGEGTARGDQGLRRDPPGRGSFFQLEDREERDPRGAGQVVPPGPS